MAYKILSLDGGGTWALIQIRCLQELFGKEATGHQVLRHFDLITANSGGSIVAAGLAVNLKLSELLEQFESLEKRQNVFVKLKLFESFGNQLFRKGARLLNKRLGPKYSTQKKREGLEKNLSEAPLSPLLFLDEFPVKIGKNRHGKDVHLLICGFDYERKRAEFFRSDTESRANSYVLNGGVMDTEFKRIRLVDAIHASTNAPVNYFNEPAKVQFHTFKAPKDETIFPNYFWDGAVGGNNNPVKAGVIEALSNGIDPKDMYALSIGTGGQLLPLRSPQYTYEDEVLLQPKPDPGLLTDIPIIAESILNEPPDAATFEAYAILYPKLPKSDLLALNRLVRMNPMIQPILKDNKWVFPEYIKKWGDASKSFRQLMDMKLDALKEDEIRLISFFCEAWITNEVPNQSIRSNSKLESVLGYKCFIEAKKAFESWK